MVVLHFNSLIFVGKNKHNRFVYRFNDRNEYYSVEYPIDTAEEEENIETILHTLLKKQTLTMYQNFLPNDIDGMLGTRVLLVFPKRDK